MPPGAIVLAAAVLSVPVFAEAQARCASREVARDSVNALTDCLTDPNPEIRDGIAFESLSKLLRAGSLDATALRRLRDRLLPIVSQGGSALQTSFRP